MRVFKYSILCEDDAQFHFAKTLLGHHFKDNAEFVLDEKFYKTFRCSNKQDVYNSYVIQIERSSYLSKYDLDLVLVGIDFDSTNTAVFPEKLNKLYLRLNEKARKKAIIFYPVQAIEHWILFLQRRKANPSLSKNLTKEIESIIRKEAKQMAYPKTVSDKNAMIVDHVKNCDVEWLCLQSESFREFYTSITDFIEGRNRYKP